MLFIMMLVNPSFSIYPRTFTSAWTFADDCASKVASRAVLRSLFSNSSSLGREPLMPLAANLCSQAPMAFGRASAFSTGRYAGSNLYAQIRTTLGDLASRKILYNASGKTQSFEKAFLILKSSRASVEFGERKGYSVSVRYCK